jgi:hypothetical protein
MSKAETVSTTSRRSFLAAAAVAAAIVARKVAVGRAGPGPTEAATADWEAFYQELSEKLVVFQRRKVKRDQWHKAFARWQKRNPPPTEPDYCSQTERIDDFQRQRVAEKRYQECYEIALTQCGFGALKKAEDDAFSDYDAVCNRIALIPVKNLADIRGKSRCAELENKTGPIHRLMIKELRSI